MEQLSGYNPDEGPVVFSLIPSKSTDELGYDMAEKQQNTLSELRRKAPNLNLKVPSVLDALTFWYTLRARGDKLNDSSSLNKTYIRHFNLSAKKLATWLYVPNSYVSDGGKPRLNRSSADGDARVAVG